MKLLAPSIIAGLLLIAPRFAWAESSLFSGFELFPGIKLGGVTIGATFSGWTDDSLSEWVPFHESTGGFVSGTINYSGSPGFGHRVHIFGGAWSWLEADDHTEHAGPVLNGDVVWPSDAQTDLGERFGFDCGVGVARFTVKVSDHVTKTRGTISGCLNDQLVFPPKIWGQVDLSSVP